MSTHFPVAVVLFLGSFMLPTTIARATDSLVSAPENGGLRLGFAVEPRTDRAGDGYAVRLELRNVSEHAITVRAGWRGDDPGGVDDYLEAATSIECEPAIAPWIGGVPESMRSLPQPDLRLAPGDVLAVDWQTEGRRLKNRVTNPNEVQNPEFPFPGLYAVHATLEVITSDQTVLLRSNEQLVSAGGSHSQPRHTVGPLLSVDGKRKTAVLGLGALHQVEKGDQFDIGSPKGMHWRLTVTEIKPRYALGTLELLTRSTYPPYSLPPHPMMDAVFIPLQ